jgi:hypothetical protein
VLTAVAGISFDSPLVGSIFFIILWVSDLRMEKRRFWWVH